MTNEPLPSTPASTSPCLPTSGRLRPATSRDTSFFWDGLNVGELRIQRCTGCSNLRHPPGPACPECHGFDWDYVLATGLGTIHSHTTPHHPLVAGFDAPAVVVLVDLDEGVRLVSNLEQASEEPAIGDRVTAFFLEQDEGYTVHQFRLVDPEV